MSGVSGMEMLDEVLWHPDAVHGGLSWEEQVGAAEKRGVFVAGGSVRIRQTLGGNHILAVASKIVVGGKRTYPVLDKVYLHGQLRSASYPQAWQSCAQLSKAHPQDRSAPIFSTNNCIAN